MFEECRISLIGFSPTAKENKSGGACRRPPSFNIPVELRPDAEFFACEPGFPGACSRAIFDFILRLFRNHWAVLVHIQILPVSCRCLRDYSACNQRQQAMEG
jgi:hypothetical protein